MEGTPSTPRSWSAGAAATCHRSSAENLKQNKVLPKKGKFTVFFFLYVCMYIYKGYGESQLTARCKGNRPHTDLLLTDLSICHMTEKDDLPLKK